ncbi:hypothetical protein ACFO5R_18240 [Halosolutus amylolyticus]|uniref:Uncharacterized protein n=1 Tax=Halosolutus amylolyticus TaxID=2932267 RepID=A0ABD5PV73_9EURY|nr:hypothetical protein [Halosolutus amylolyticus]
MTDPHRFGRLVHPHARTIVPFLVALAITIVGVVVYLGLVGVFLEILPELVG